MKQNVLFLGAGSSKPFGIPLTNEILPLILDGLDNNELYNANEKYCSILRSFIYGLMPGLKENRYICSITDILSLIDYMLLHSISPSPMNKKKGLRIYRNLVVKALLEVLNLSELFESSSFLDLSFRLSSLSSTPSLSSFWV